MNAAGYCPTNWISYYRTKEKKIEEVRVEEDEDARDELMQVQI